MLLISKQKERKFINLTSKAARLSNRRNAFGNGPLYGRISTASAKSITPLAV